MFPPPPRHKFCTYSANLTPPHPNFDTHFFAVQCRQSLACRPPPTPPYPLHKSFIHMTAVLGGGGYPIFSFVKFHCILQPNTELNWVLQWQIQVGGV